MFKLKQHIGIFLLTIFFSLKLIGLHGFTHTEDDIDTECSTCEYAITLNVTAFFISKQNTTTPAVVCHTHNTQPPLVYSHTFVESKIGSFLFSRPPPTL